MVSNNTMEDFRGRARIEPDQRELWDYSDALWQEQRSHEPVVCKELRGRTRKRVIHVKKHHRTDLSPDEWSKYDHHKTWKDNREKLINFCNGDITGIHSKTTNITEFQKLYERPGIPCIIHGIADEWPAREEWNYAKLREKLGERLFKCGEDDDGYTLKLKLKHFFRYQFSDGDQGAKRDDSPLYIFDSHFDDDEVSNVLLKQYEKPHVFKEDLFQMVGEKKRPPYRWVLFGPERSGSNVHIDPLGTSAWNTLIKGRKLWILFPPDVSKKLVKAKHLRRKGEDDEPLDWFVNLLPRVLDEGGPSVRDRIVTFVQYPGETVYVPSNWWHSVLNLDDTIAVTQNFASTGNFDIVWPSTRKGRKRMAWKWLEVLKVERPDLAERAMEMDKSDNYDLRHEIDIANEKRKEKRHRKDSSSDSDSS